MSSPEDTHANHSAPLGSAEDKTTRDICGPRCSEPLAFYDPELRSWRMSGVITLWGLTVCLETLPTSGMTQSGKLFRRSPWVRHIAESGSSAWPTPTVDDSKNVNPKENRFHGLVAAVAMWPTPTTQEIEHPDLTLTETGRRMSLDGLTSHSLNLADAVRMWPTPRAAMGEQRNHTVYARPLTSPQNLENRIAQVDGPAIGGRLNPMWVEWLMGFPLGWTDLEA